MNGCNGVNVCDHENTAGSHKVTLVEEYFAIWDVPNFFHGAFITHVFVINSTVLKIDVNWITDNHRGRTMTQMIINQREGNKTWLFCISFLEIPNFLTEEECQHIMQKAKETGLELSEVALPEEQDKFASE